LHEFDGFFFYTTENPVAVDKPDEPAMTIQGKQNLSDAVMGGTGFIGSHCASDTFNGKGDRKEAQEVPDPIGNTRVRLLARISFFATFDPPIVKRHIRLRSR